MVDDMRQSDSSDISVQISIINDNTGEIVLNNTDNYHIVPNRIEALSKWKGRPLAVIELNLLYLQGDKSNTCLQ